MRLSFALIPVLAAVVSAQGTVVTAAPETTNAPGAEQPSDCNACFIVANVNQIIFADFTSTATASAVVSAGTGRNGSTVTTTYVQPAQQFSFGPGGLLGGTSIAASYVQLTGTVITLSGVALTSPTAYNVFGVYTSFTKTSSGGSCITRAVSVFSTSGIRFPILPNEPATAIFEAESSFITSIGLVTCSAQAVVVSTTVPVSVTTTTMTSSTSGLARPTSLPETSAASSTSASTSAVTTTSVNSTSAAATSATSTTTSFALLTPTPTIVVGAGSAFHPRSFSASLVAALLIIPGIAAWML